MGGGQATQANIPIFNIMEHKKTYVLVLTKPSLHYLK